MVPPIVVDLILAALILGLTYALTSEGLWGAATMFFNVLFAALITFNFYEPLASMLASNVSFLSGFADTLCMMAIFITSVFMFRLTTETIAPTMVRFPPAVYNLGRILFGFAGSLVTVAVILLAFEAAPVHKKVFGVVDYQYAPPFHWGLDHKWLGFFQNTTGYVFADHTSKRRDPLGEFGNARVFDPKAEWLLKHQDARPYGEGEVLGGDAAKEGAAGGAPGGAGAPGAAPAAAGGGGARPGDPTVVGPAVGGGVVIPGN